MNDPLDIIKGILDPSVPLNKEDFKCPNCDGYIPNNENIGAYSGALSRRDNKTEICSSCGTLEAFADLLSPLVRKPK